MNRMRNLINAYKFEIFACFFIFFLTFTIYFHCTNFDFTHFDDNFLILNRVQNMENLSYAKNLFANTVYASTSNSLIDKYYRPVLTLTFLTDTLICAGAPGFYHYSNIIWHTLAAFMLLICMRAMGYSKKISASAAILFAAHPALTAATAWIPGRNDSLLAVFSLLSFIFFIQCAKNNKLAYGILSGFFFLTALLTKESAIVLPALFILYIMLYGVKTERKTSAQLLVCLLSAFVIYASARHFVLSSGASIIITDMLINLFLSLKATLWYCGIALLTEKILIYPQLSALTVVKSAVSISLIAVLCALLRKSINFKHILFGAAWFILFLLPTYVLPENIFLPHRLYMPMFGFLIIIFEILKAAFIKFPKIKKILFVIFGILTICLSLMSYNRTFFYKDRESFWLRAVYEDPEEPRANASVSSLYLDKGNMLQAQEHAFKALQYAKGTNTGNALLQIAIVYNAKGEMEKSAEYYKKAIETDKTRDSGYIGLSYIYEKQKNKQAALDILNEGAAVIPQSKSIKKRIAEIRENRRNVNYTIYIKMP